MVYLNVYITEMWSFRPVGVRKIKLSQRYDLKKKDEMWVTIYNEL